MKKPAVRITGSNFMYVCMCIWWEDEKWDRKK